MGFWGVWCELSVGGNTLVAQNGRTGIQMGVVLAWFGRWFGLHPAVGFAKEESGLTAGNVLLQSLCGIIQSPFTLNPRAPRPLLSMHKLLDI